MLRINSAWLCLAATLFVVAHQTTAAAQSLTQSEIIATAQQLEDEQEAKLGRETAARLESEIKQLEARFSELQSQKKHAESAPVLEEIVSKQVERGGPNHPSAAQSLEDLAGIYRTLEDWELCHKARKRAHTILLTTYGEKYWMTIDAAWKLARAERLLKDEPFRDDLAKVLLLDTESSAALQRRDVQTTYMKQVEALQLRIKTFGAESREAADGRHNLGSLLVRLGQFAMGAKHLEAAVQTRIAIQGTDHPQTVSSRSNLGFAYVSLAQYGKARPLYESVLVSYQKRYGKESEQAAGSLINLAYLLQKQGDLIASRDRYGETLEIYQRLFGESRNTAVAMNNLAGVQMELGQDAEALENLKAALGILLKLKQEVSLFGSATFNSLGACHLRLGNYDLARHYFERCLNVMSKIRGTNQVDEAATLTNLAGVATALGDAEAAEKYLEQSLEVTERVVGDHPRTARCLLNLADLLLSVQQPAKARDFAERGWQIWRKTVGDDHLETADALEKLVYIDLLLGKPEQARKTMESIVKVRAKKLPDDEYFQAESYNTMATIEAATGNHEKEVELLKKVIDLRADKLGPDHRSVIDAKVRLGAAYLVMSEFDSAAKLAEDVLQYEVEAARTLLPSLAESEAMKYVRDAQSQRDTLLNALRGRGSAQKAYHWVLQTRGLATDAIARRRRIVHKLPEAKSITDQLGLVRKQLAQLTLAEPSPAQLSARREQLRTLTQSKENLERALAQVSKPFRDKERQARASLKDLIAKLPPETALVEFVETQSVGHDQASGTKRLQSSFDAFVIRSDRPTEQQVTWIPLGDASPINDAVTQWRQQIALAQGRGLQLEKAAPATNRQPSDETRNDQQVRKLVWAPIENAVGDANTVLVVPDGILTATPWAAIPREGDNGYLIEKHAISTVAGGQQVVRMLETSPAKSDESEMLLVGGVKYDLADAANPSSDTASRSNQARSAKWKFLPETLTESRRIRDLHPSGAVAMLEGVAASESSLRTAAESARYLHLATHGFFADKDATSILAQRISARDVSRGAYTQTKYTVTGRNPLVLSGLVLAGANRQTQVDAAGVPLGDDGILTAEEVVDLNLSKTELVVLSACETGIGKVAGGEGVFGLQRAFQTAGADSVVASLWKVDDVAAKQFMLRFYQNLWQRKMSKLAALREAQLWMLKNPVVATTERGLRLEDQSRSAKTPPNPRQANVSHWAAFVLSGDWR